MSFRRLPKDQSHAADTHLHGVLDTIRNDKRSSVLVFVFIKAISAKGTELMERVGSLQVPIDRDIRST